MNPNAPRNEEVSRDEDYALPDAPDSSDSESGIETAGTNQKPNDLLKEVMTWKLDAKMEDPQRYFFHVREAEQAVRGERCYIIGRKGAGKTAISEYISKVQNAKVFTEKLTFKNFPFNDLYQHPNNQFKAPNQYITLWKYLIYSFICRMMVRNENINPTVRASLAKVYQPDAIKSLTRAVKGWTSKEFQVTILGTGGAIKLANPETESQTIPERCDALEDVILEHLDDSNYYIIFDELDEDFKDILKAKQNLEYIALITSLFKAVQDIKSVFKGARYKVYPLVFLRDDIYDFIGDPDKNKWNDYRIDLEWNQEKIKDLLAFRLSRALDPTGKILSFDVVWSLFFTQNTIHFGDRGRSVTTIFSYITRSTHLRPRDYVKYLQACAAEAINAGRSRVRPGIVRRVDKAFSNYLRNEIVDEVQAIIPDINQVLDVFSEIRKQILSQEEFRTAYVRRAKQENWIIKDPDYVLRILFHFSVIGNQTRQKNLKIFFYLNKESRLNTSELIVVHRGLFKSLQIM